MHSPTAAHDSELIVSTWLAHHVTLARAFFEKLHPPQVWPRACIVRNSGPLACTPARERSCKGTPHGVGQRHACRPRTPPRFAERQCSLQRLSKWADLKSLLAGSRIITRSSGGSALQRHQSLAGRQRKRNERHARTTEPPTVRSQPEWHRENQRPTYDLRAALRTSVWALLPCCRHETLLLPACAAGHWLLLQ